MTNTQIPQDTPIGFVRSTEERLTIIMDHLSGQENLLNDLHQKLDMNCPQKIEGIQKTQENNGQIEKAMRDLTTISSNLEDIISIISANNRNIEHLSNIL